MHVHTHTHARTHARTHTHTHTHAHTHQVNKEIPDAAVGTPVVELRLQLLMEGTVEVKQVLNPIEDGVHFSL